MSLQVDSDYTGWQYKAVVIVGADLAVVPIEAFSGVAGILQNEPNADRAIIRYGGVSNAIYGAVVTTDAYLTIEPATGRVVPMVYGSFGHTHTAAAREIRRLVYLTSFAAVPVTGASPSDFTAVLKWDNAGTLTAAGETVTITESGSGFYFATFTPTNLFSAYYLWLTYASGGVPGVLTPSEFQIDPPTDYSGPAFVDSKLIIGQALTSGIANDIGVIIVKPQLF